MPPVLVVLSYATGAALLSALGVVPLIGRDKLPQTWLGWANAAAAGTMLSAAYALAESALRAEQAPQMGLGAAVGIGFIWWTHAFSGTDELDLNRTESSGPSYGYEVLLMSALHSAAEGLGIGVAMAVDIPFGVVVAVAIALHNIPEATLLAAVYRARGTSLRRAAVLAVLSDVGLIFVSVSTFAVLEAAPGALPWALGFASGSLLYLVMVDLLPESYREAGPTSIGLVTLLAMGLVAATQGLLR